MKSRILLLLIAIGLAGASVGAQHKTSGPARAQVGKTRAIAQPGLSQLAGDSVRLKAKLAENFVAVLPDGSLIDKKEMLSRLADGRIALGKAEETNTVSLGTTRITTGLVRINDQKMVRFSEIWSLSAAKWVLLSWQATTAGPSQYLAKRLAEGKKVITTESGLQYFDVVEGTGEAPKSGNQVTVHYTGTLENGQKFDSSVDRGQPFEFTIGVGRVIKGWDEGVLSMKVGGKRRLIIPPQLAYGSRGVGPIPPDSTLVFEVELLGVK